MSRLHVECPACNGVFDVKAFRAGHRVACKLCGSVVRVPTDGVPVPAPDSVSESTAESTRETPPVLKRMAFADSSSDAIYDDIFADTDEELPQTGRSRGPGLTLSRPMLVRIGIGLIALLALYVAYQAGRRTAPVAPVVVPTPPAPVVPQYTP